MTVHEEPLMPTWIDDAVFYHIYPLGLLDAPRTGDAGEATSHRLRSLHDWSDHIRALGCNALYLGPVFQSATHGYDTTGYTRVDRRLGDNRDLANLVEHYHNAGIQVVLDGVFNHVGRDFPGFRDVLDRGEDSAYRDWFADLEFGQQSPLGDPFTYTAWAGNFELVKLNLANPDVRRHLFDAVRLWFAEFGIDGIRFDAADSIDHDFLREMAAVCRDANPDCWLMGEVVHGDYREWAGEGMLDSCTNYECFKGLYSSFNDRNMHEIAWSLNRQFGPEGIYRDLRLYSFADNHDVNRVASLLDRAGDLSSLYALLFTIPGVPSIYYGSEWGIPGEKHDGNDAPLRPPFTWPVTVNDVPQPWLASHIALLAEIRNDDPALRHGSYAQLHVGSEQLAVCRATERNVAIVLVNAASDAVSLVLDMDSHHGCVLVDRLDPTVSTTVQGGKVEVQLSPNSARILTGRTSG